jgi:hypothetical protein
MKILILFLLSFNLFAAGTVTKLKGKLTILLPNSKKAIPLTKGMHVPDDSSIVAHSRSFAIVQFNEGTKIIIGSNSKVVVDSEINKKQAGIITLLQGRIRSKVEKSNNNKTKFIIKTKQAALGVRGTDFIVVYENNSSSLITFKGEVAVIERNEESIDKIINKLNNEKVNIARKGEVSAVNSNKASLKPQLISKEQLANLKKSAFLINSKSTKKQKVVGKIIDIQTGQIVSGKLGFVDGTGNYVSPKNTTLTVNGFVPNNKNSRKSVEKVTRLNSELGEKYRRWTVLYAPSYYSLVANGKDASSEIRYEDTSILKHDLEVATDDLYNHFYAKFSFYSADFSSLGCRNCSASQSGINNSNENLYDLATGYRRYFTDVFTFGAEASLSSRPLLENVNGSWVSRKMSVKRLSLTAVQNIFSWKDKYIYVGEQVDYINSSEDYSGFGLKIKAGVDYLFNQKYGVNAEVFRGSETLERGADEINYESFGIGLGFRVQF